MASIRSQTRKWAASIAPRTWIWKDTYSIGGIRQLDELLNGVLPVKAPSQPSLYGFHFVFNTTSNIHLGRDGYDNYQAPLDGTNNQLYQRRMWVNGTLEFLQPPPVAGDIVSCTENISSVRCFGTNAFVSISRVFTRNESVIMKEARTLLYTNELYRGAPAKPLPLEKQFEHSAPIKFTLAQLMRFSALSYNLHKIHYDADFCRKENLRNVVVSGPFLVSTMLRFFTLSYPALSIKSFKYKNAEPCYIEEDVILGIEQTAAGYQIGIVKDGSTCCTATVTV